MTNPQRAAGTARRGAPQGKSNLNSREAPFRLAGRPTRKFASHGGEEESESVAAQPVPVPGPGSHWHSESVWLGFLAGGSGGHHDLRRPNACGTSEPRDWHLVTVNGPHSGSAGSLRFAPSPPSESRCPSHRDWHLHTESERSASAAHWQRLSDRAEQAILRVHT